MTIVGDSQTMQIGATIRPKRPTVRVVTLHSVALPRIFGLSLAQSSPSPPLFHPPPIFPLLPAHPSFPSSVFHLPSCLFYLPSSALSHEKGGESVHDPYSRLRSTPFSTLTSLRHVQRPLHLPDYRPGIRQSPSTRVDCRPLHQAKQPLDHPAHQPPGQPATIVHHHPWTVWLAHSDLHLWKPGLPPGQPVQLVGIQPSHRRRCGRRGCRGIPTECHPQFAVRPTNVLRGTGSA